MKKWFCSRINLKSLRVNYLSDAINEVLQECESLEKDGYKIEQIVYMENDKQYQIFYSRTKRGKQ